MRDTHIMKFSKAPLQVQFSLRNHNYGRNRMLIVTLTHVRLYRLVLILTFRQAITRPSGISEWKFEWIIPTNRYASVPYAFIECTFRQWNSASTFK